MPVNYKALDENKKSSCYEIEFEFEHGDADSYSNETVIFNNMNEEQLIEYVKKSNEISQMIEDSRAGGDELTDNFYAQAKCGEFEIPVELDNYAKMQVSNYYAASGISKIFYYNEYGNKFEVTVD